MSKFSQFLHGLGATIQKAASAAGPDVTKQLDTIGGALHSVADLVETKEAQAYLGPIVGAIVGNMLNAGTDNLAKDLGAAQSGPIPGA